jgi:Ca2+-binding EF-hand superfamily protein
MKFAHLVAYTASALCIALPAMAQSTGQQPGNPPSAQQPGNPPSATSGTASKDANAQKRSMKVKQGQTRKQTFDRLDTNGDGYISRSEAQASPELVLIFVDTDTNGDGQISPAEFVIVPITQDDGTMVQ